MPLLLRDRRRPIPYPNQALSLVTASSQNGNISDSAHVGLDPGTSDFSLELWLNCTSLAALRCFCGKGSTADVAGSAEGYFCFLNTTGTIGIRMGDTANTTRITYTSAATVTANTWTHLVANFDRDASLTCYLNTVATTALSIATRQGQVDSTWAFALGSASTGVASFGSYWSGYLDAVRFRNRLMTLPEISRSYNNGTGLAYRDLTGEERSGIVSAWDLDNSLRDAHGPNHLTPLNNPTYFAGKR